LNALAVALGCEVLKARRSRVPLFTLLGFSLAPLAGGLFMLILKDPVRARQMGLIGAKAQIAAGTADWPSHLGFIAAATAVGGGVLFAVITAWVFGREFSDRTVKLLLAVPTARTTIVAAKFLVVAAWSGLLSVWIFILGLGIGALLELPGWSAAMATAAAANTAVTALLTIALITPTALLASWGRGYLAPLASMMLTVFLAQIIAAIGWGAYFPWSVPPLLSGMAGPSAAELPLTSYLLVALTSAAGLAGTLAFWSFADQPT
jgi:ABC-2 type transport system permease protein